MEKANIDSIIAKHRSNGNGIISILQDIQAKFSYLPQEALIQVARETGKSLVDIYGVATFYKSFSLNPKGKHHVTCCLGTACHVRGGPTIADEFQKILAIKPGQTTKDEEFSFDTVACLGACALGPIVVVDGQYFSKVDKNKVKNIDVASNGKEALDKFGTTKYDIILMDIQMPIMNGIIATKKIRELELSTNVQTPIIAITANALSGDKEACLAAGMNEYISKPFQVEVLLQKMRNLLSFDSQTIN